MGRFYQTSDAKFVDDKMFEAPHQLMAQVLQNKDKEIDTEITSATAYLDKLKADVLTQDSPELQQEIKNYEAKITGIVDNIKSNPLEYNKYSSDIMHLGRDINANWTTGKIGTMQQYKKNVVAEYDKLDELAKKDPSKYDAAYIAAEKANILAKYQGINWNADMNKAGASPDIQNAYYAADFDDKFLQHMKASGYSVEKDTRGGNGYIYRHKEGGKQLTKEEIANAMYSQLTADNDYQQAVERRKQLGISGYENADLSKAYVYEKNEKGIPQFKGFNTDHYGKMINAAAQTYSHKETEKSDTIHNDEGYWKTWDRANKLADDAKEEAENVNTSYEAVYQVGTNSASNFQSNLVQTNQNLGAIQDNIATQITNLKVKPGSDMERLIKKGNVQAMVAAGMSEASATQLSSQLKSEQTKKNLLNAQALGFIEYAKKTGKKFDTTKNGWLNDPKAQKAYNEYLTVNGTKEKNNTKENLVTLNGIGLNKNTITELKGVIEQRFDDLSFNIDQTVKGSQLKFEDKSGNEIVYVAANDKRAGKTEKVKAGIKPAVKTGYFDFKLDKPAEQLYKTRTYKVAPGGKLSVSQLISEGGIEQRTNKEGKKIFITRQNGKEVGLMVDEKTVGLDMALDNAGQSNLGMSVQIGDYRLPALVSTNQISTPSIDAHISKNRPEMEWRRTMNQTNIKTLGKKTVPALNGEFYETNHGKAYIIHTDGSKTELLNEGEIDKVHQIIYSEQN